MEKNLAETYVCPATKGQLQLEPTLERDSSVIEGRLVGPEGHTYRIDDGIPDFTHPPELDEIAATTREEYDAVASEIYDNAVDWQFKAMYEDEDEVRERMIDGLSPGENDRILEIGCGTGRDSYRLARRLSAEGELYLQDLSPRMVEECRRTIGQRRDELDFSCLPHFFISNANYLPFPDGYFDKVFHFGGFNQFPSQEDALEELTRVVTVGGTVLIGDESVAPWLRGTEFEGIVTTNNPLFAHPLPIDKLPPNATNVELRWILGNCFYVFVYDKGKGSPELDLDLPHKGRRGGTMRTRFYGKLEGVTLEAKDLAWRAADKQGISMHEWLDSVVRERAKEDLDE